MIGSYIVRKKFSSVLVKGVGHCELDNSKKNEEFCSSAFLYPYPVKPILVVLSLNNCSVIVRTFLLRL